MVDLSLHLHPALTAFPAALLPAALLLEVWSMVRRSPSASSAARILVTLGVIGVVAAFISGYQASELADQFFEVPDEPISAHHAVGRLLLFVSIPMLAVMWIGEFATHAKGMFQAIYRVLLLVSVGLVCYSGYLGGELIFRYGAGVHARGASPRGELRGPEGLDASPLHTP
jgi:uncharacterized membrane protein